MRTLVLAAAVLFTGLAQAATDFQLSYGDATICAPVVAQLAASVEISGLTIPATAPAGKDLVFDFHLSKSAPLDATVWNSDFSSANLNSIIAKPYPKYVHHAPTPDLTAFLFAADTSADFHVVTPVPEHVGGTARLELSLYLVSKTASCGIHALVGQPTELVSVSPDIVPPLARAITLDKPHYAPGDEVTLRVRFSKPLDKAETNHIEFINPEMPEGDLTRGFPGYLSDGIYALTLLPSGEYLVRFSVPPAAKPGSYYLAWWNRADAFGNFEDQVGSVDALEESVAHAAPIVVQ